MNTVLECLKQSETTVGSAALRVYGFSYRDRGGARDGGGGVCDTCISTHHRQQAHTHESMRSARQAS